MNSVEISSNILNMFDLVRGNCISINEFLKANGTFITEVDFNNNGVYAGTKYYYLHNNTLYCRYEPTNAFQYNGKVDTYEVIDNVKEEFKKYNEDYFIFEIGLDEEGYIKLKEIYEEEDE